MALSQPRLFRLFADLLDYPQAGLLGALRELLSSPQDPAAPLLWEFYRFAEETPLGRLQEVYTVTFDLDATYHPYLGYHLFGETYKRSAFLVGLKERYQQEDFTFPEGQLPDHLPIVLRFLSVCAAPELAGELVDEGLLPTLAKMLKKDRAQAEGPGEDVGNPSLCGEAEEEGGEEEEKEEGPASPYAKVLEALWLALQQQYSTGKAVASHV